MGWEGEGERRVCWGLSRPKAQSPGGQVWFRLHLGLCEDLARMFEGGGTCCQLVTCVTEQGEPGPSSSTLTLTHLTWLVNRS